jgi:hypothetical protein
VFAVALLATGCAARQSSDQAPTSVSTRQPPPRLQQQANTGATRAVTGGHATTTANAKQSVSPARGTTVATADTASAGAGARCDGGVTLPDGPSDSRSWTMPNRATAMPPSGDLRRFDLRSTRAGVCARFTVAGAFRVGTELDLVAHAPWKRFANGAAVAYAYGYKVELRERGGVATYGLDRLGSDRPRVLRALVTWAGNVASVFVARSELDRPPANMPDRPPFPYRKFGFQARVITPAGRDGSQSIDFAPNERTGDAGYVDGRLCTAPCKQLGSP